MDEENPIIPSKDKFSMPGLRDEYPGAIKREVRKEWVWFLWLTQHTQEEIAGIVGCSRGTVVNDLNDMKEQLAKHPIDHEHVRQLALIQMRFAFAEIIHAARDAESEHAKAKLYDVAAGIQEKILDRFTQAATINQRAVKSEMDRAQALIEYMIEKYGPDSLDGFEEWYTKRKVAKAEYKTRKT